MTDEPRSEPGHGTPEGYTPEEPAAEEPGQPGTPGAGLTPDTPHAADAEALEHDQALPNSDDDHGHAEATLGPIDWAAWSYALIGVLAALAVVALFWIAIS